jgi:hypothetical protein
MIEATITTATIPRSLLIEMCELAVCAQTRADFSVRSSAGSEFPTHKLLEFVHAADKLREANVVLIEDPALPELEEQLPWDQDSLAEDSVKSPCNPLTGNTQLPPEAALE